VVTPCRRRLAMLFIGAAVLTLVREMHGRQQMATGA